MSFFTVLFMYLRFNHFRRFLPENISGEQTWCEMKDLS